MGKVEGRCQVKKNCVVCSAELDDGNWDKHCKKVYINKCAGCVRSEKRVWQANWRKKNPGAATQRATKHKALLRVNDPVKARAREAYSDARKRAIRQRMPFDLTGPFVLQLMREAIVCPYFGWTLTYAASGKARTLASLDRVDSSKGYTKDNVRVVCYLANLMKSSATEGELIDFANGVLRQHQREPVAA